MMPRSGTNWVYDILKTSEFTCDIGPVWEDNILNHTAGVKKLAKSIAGSWDPKWETRQIKLDVNMTQLQLEERIEKGIEAFIFDSIRKESVQKTPAWVLLKSPNAWETIPPRYLLSHNKCIILVRHPIALIQSGMKSFGWNLFGACFRYNAAAKSILQLRNSSQTIHYVKFEELGEDLNTLQHNLFQYLKIPIPEIDLNSLPVRGQSSTGSVSWESSDLKTVDKVHADQQQTPNLGLRGKIILCLCQNAAIELGYKPMAAPSRALQVAAKTLFSVFIILRKLKK
jgi:hypothetical protein